MTIYLFDIGITKFLRCKIEMHDNMYYFVTQLLD